MSLLLECSLYFIPVQHRMPAFTFTLKSLILFNWWCFFSFLQLEEKMMRRELDVLVANHSQSNTKDILEPFKHALEALGYRVVLSTDTEILPYMRKKWQGIHWCSGRETSPCFNSSDLVFLQKNQRVRMCCYQQIRDHQRLVDHIWSYSKIWDF